MTPEQIQREIVTFSNRMSEHVDSIRIVVTAPEEGNTAMHTAGIGNWYAQYGSVKEWLSKNDNQDLASSISVEIHNSDPDSEGDSQTW